MKNKMPQFRTLWALTSLLVLGIVMAGCHPKHSLPSHKDYSALQDSLQVIAANAPGEVGIALIIDSQDTLVVNNSRKYPMMSVFKLHQAIASCHYLERQNISIDTIVSINKSQLNPSTWSPMLKDYSADTINISYRGLLSYALEQSDNNASNYLFEHLLSPAKTDDYIATLIPRESFKIEFSEADMLSDHSLAYANATSPLGAAELINKLFTDSLMIHGDSYTSFIRESLKQCKTGTDRIVAPLINNEEVTIAHKTGSGFSDNGVLAAHNDVAFIELPNDSLYALAVFVKDFHGNESEASKIIAKISKTVYEAIRKQ